MNGIFFFLFGVAVCWAVTAQIAVCYWRGRIHDRIGRMYIQIDTTSKDVAEIHEKVSRIEKKT